MPYVMRPGEHVVGIDIGGTNILATVIDHELRIVARCKKKSRSKKGSDSTEDRIVKAVQEALTEAGVTKIKGIGAGAPGPLDPVKGIIFDTPNLAWKRFPLAKMLSESFGVPAAVDNDVNLGTYGEWYFGKIRECRYVVGIFPGTGIGGGFIIDGKLYYGFSGSACEIGHMTVEVNGPFCGCGKRGCLEAVASRIAIAEQIAALAARYDAPFIYDNCGTDLNEIRSTIIAKAIESGEKKVEAVVRKAAYYVGIAVGNLVNILSPDAIVLGGGLVEAMQELYVEEVTRGMDDHALPYMRKNVRLVTARLGDDAVAMGAGLHILDKLDS